MPVERSDPQRIFEHISENEWLAMYARLVVYTKRLVKSKVWYGIPQGEMPSGFCVNDFIQEAIEKVLIGERKWNPSKVDLFVYLCGVIRSSVSHLASGSENRNVRLDIRKSDDADIPDGGGRFELARWQSVEDEIFVSQIRRFVQKEFEGDLLIIQIVDVILNDNNATPTYIASVLHEKVKDIENAMKRIRRRSSIFLQIVEGGKDERG